MLGSLAPETATMLRNGKEEVISAEDVLPGRH